SSPPCVRTVNPDEHSPSQVLPECPPGEQAPAVEATPPPPPVVVVTPPPPPPAPMPPVKHERRASRVFAPHQISITTGAGVANYFGKSDVGDSVDPGA